MSAGNRTGPGRINTPRGPLPCLSFAVLCLRCALFVPANSLLQHTTRHHRHFLQASQPASYTASSPTTLHSTPLHDVLPETRDPEQHRVRGTEGQIELRRRKGEADHEPDQIKRHAETELVVRVHVLARRRCLRHLFQQKELRGFERCVRQPPVFLQ